MEQTTQEQKKVTPGHIQHLSIDLNHPAMHAFEITVNEFTMLCGKNGTGKTFSMEMVWAVSFIVTAVAGERGMKTGVFSLPSYSQWVFDRVFRDNKLDGKVKASFEHASIDVLLEEGKVTYIDVTLDEEVNSPMPVTFMSAEMRLFSALDKYLAIRKMTGKNEPFVIEAMTQFYKLYDIIFVESLIVKCPVKFTPEIRGILEKSFEIKEPIETIEVDKEKCEFFARMEDGERKAMHTYSNGYQAVFLMTIGAM